MEKGRGCKWNMRAKAGTFYFLQGREKVQKWRWMIALACVVQWIELQPVQKRKWVIDCPIIFQMEW